MAFHRENYAWWSSLSAAAAAAHDLVHRLGELLAQPLDLERVRSLNEMNEGSVLKECSANAISLPFHVGHVKGVKVFIYLVSKVPSLTQ